MSVDRPTFSESWYRVAELTPRLHGAVGVQRQHYRGVRWFVIQDPSSGRYFRVSEAAYHFVALLDGRRTVNHVWQTCMEQFGDAAPTQGEVIHVLCQLHDANLLQGNLAPDARALFQRYRKKVWRDIRSAMGSLFFIRIPLWDPDRFLDRWAAVVGPLFSRCGLILWGLLLLAGVAAIGSHAATLAARAPEVLAPGNLPLLYASILIVKLIHELGHAFACKHFGRQSGTGGEVHQMGLTLLFFTPLPFVDASSSWALPNKWHRILVGAGGMLAELAVAALAAIVWVQTAAGTTMHAIAYNIMLIASVSSLAFNGNPFLRYDAYYILLDLLEIPNLDARSKLYLAYLVKRHVWGLERVVDPSHTPGERGWLVFYAVAAFLCRTMILAAIAVMLMNLFPAIGTMLAAILVLRWALLPLGRLTRYLLVSPELAIHRSRALITSLAVAAALGLSVGIAKLPDRFRIEGVVEPVDYSVLHMQTAGFVRTVLTSGTHTGPDGPPLLTAHSPELVARREELMAKKRQLQLRRRSAETRETAAAQIMDQKIAALEEQLVRIGQDLDALNLFSPLAGVWVAPDAERLAATFVNRGERIGVVVDLERLRIRAVANQQVASRLIADARPHVAIRAKNRPDLALTGRIQTIIPAGQEQLPSAALGYAAGGGTRIDLSDDSGTRSAEPFFEILVAPDDPAAVGLKPGQTMALRFETTPKPLAVQGWRSLLQLFQKRGHA
ncbi:MAG: PqqD family peptide modification chaperone [Desulfosarcinaceae bacterium]|nr:PqqD family peptide modification chaperone [Desulfosarcinaceae bacterium]